MKVQVDRDVLVWLHKQPRNVFLTVLGAILDLVSDPLPQSSTELRDGSGRRLRVGDYRVLYRIDGDDLIIHAVGHRKDVYS
ncbi:type II toxin-antitoxin system RelE/ParE family toxin [Solwaraspora sp. WMMD406]|uniref:type II toxin-antitoxin system RelE family toxin n=1 Tax=Micromonosporaceae TaxID=28056 RepID=UPI0024172460|nr:MULTISPECIES: type II toxin-antitoxin system RelE/ParE family toxin [unclassified Solwaraspora]MDG4765277.1 type II toxin-antitoxin system RelE/ParE family toxin [Solwaraspora sp. WMMD406]WBB95026.1 type II toxin-antitoxin system RelE/ParE family toxin [Solwaraspora sp. WMMA2059]WBC21091.1 type II toxin-antitoxin system RelE/ParE family toxin [Solwaraspora sp. WMMA2080]WFE21061.1 type II toxin-antitoxin system RelE/ParE family toxin [Solwaraspora sp. WMMD937]